MDMGRLEEEVQVFQKDCVLGTQLPSHEHTRRVCGLFTHFRSTHVQRNIEVDLYAYHGETKLVEVFAIPGVG